MNAESPTPSRSFASAGVDALTIAWGYATVAGLWILLSDKAIEWWIPDPGMAAVAATLKGWAFVTITAALLYMLVQRLLRQRALGTPAMSDIRKRVRWPVVLVWLVGVTALTGACIAYSIHVHREVETRKLQATADWKARQISDWVRERLGDARYLRQATAATFAAREASASSQRLSSAERDARLGAFRTDKGYTASAIFTARGELIWSSGANDGGFGSAALKDAVTRIAGHDTPSYLGPYLDEEGGLHLDFLVPMAKSPIGLLVVVMRTDPSRHLAAMLRDLPSPLGESTGETFLFQREGDAVLYLSALKHRPDAAARLRLPLRSDDTLVAQVLRRRVSAGALLEGRDYSGRRVFGVANPVDGTDWFVITTIDRSDLFASAARDATWIAMAGTLGLVIALGGVVVLRQQRALNASQAERQAQASRIQTLNLLQALTDSSTDVIYAKDLQGRFLLFNREASRLSGKAAEDVIGKDASTVFGSDEATPRLIGFKRVMTEGKAHSEEFTITVMGSERTFLDRRAPLVNERGEIIGMLGIARDITERKLVEGELAQLSQAVEQSDEVIVITNLREKIEYANPAFERALGYRRDEVLGRRARDFHSPRVPQSTYTEMYALLALGQPWRGELITRCKDGSERVESTVISPIRRGDGTITNFVSVRQDVTETQRMARELAQHREHLEELVDSRTLELAQARERAEAASRAKSAFLANMSHEIRTPMNAIVGITGLLRRAPANEEQAERLAKIEVAAYHLLGMLNNVLDFSKIEADRMELARGDFSLNAVLDEVRSLVMQSAQAKGLTLHVKNDCEGRWFKGDATRLRQALLNYVGNAVKFTERGFVALRVTCRASDDSHDVLRFEVEDTGPGIPAERLPRVFEAFEQGDPTTTRRYGGTGLGLAITARLARLMGGDVGVSSVTGRGSLFWLTARLERTVLPTSSRTRQRSAAGSNRPPATDTQGTQARILVVEDDAINREVMAELVRDAGAQVDVAPDGLAALALLDVRRYDLVLMDLQMPKMDGLEATRALRERPSTRELSVIALSANVFEEDRRACFDAGMNDFLAKPVDMPTLLIMLGRWLPAGSLHPRASQMPADVLAHPTVDLRGPGAARSRELLALSLRLEELLRSGDMDANALWASERGRWNELLGARADSLARLMKQFDYEQAAELLAAHRPAPPVPDSASEGVTPLNG